MSTRHTLALAILLMTAAAASAQTLAVTGRVVDAQGAAVAGAVVTLNPSSTAARTIETGADGTYSIGGVAPGLAVLQVDSPGFERWARSIAVSTATPAFDVTLQISGVAETVAVEARTSGRPGCTSNRAAER